MKAFSSSLNLAINSQQMESTNRNLAKMQKDNLRFFKRLKRFNFAYFQRKIYDRKILKEMESHSGASRLSLKLNVSPKQIEQKMQEFEKLISSYYKNYVATTSSEIMAMSFELAAFTLALCEITKPKKILDLGSGFSSFCFRYWIKNYSPNSEVLSVDDAPEWLDKTREFLLGNHLQGDHLITWDELVKGDYGKFDLVFYDFGTFPVRKNSLSRVLDFASKPAMVILDDMHSAEYGLHVKQTLKERGLEFFSIRRYTKDKFSRYAYLAINSQ
jgi:predicted O-methyltransferase YrrM